MSGCPLGNAGRFLDDPVDLAFGATVHAHDPEAAHNLRIIFPDQITCFDLPRASSLLRTPILLDTRNVLDPADAPAAGFTYSGTGR